MNQLQAERYDWAQKRDSDGDTHFDIETRVKMEELRRTWKARNQVDMDGLIKVIREYRANPVEAYRAAIVQEVCEAEDSVIDILEKLLTAHLIVDWIADSCSRFHFVCTKPSYASLIAYRIRKHGYECHIDGIEGVVSAPYSVRIS